MKHEIMKTWVAALRSGEYEQTQGTLRIDGKYCCLGVLCDLAAKAKVGTWVENDFVCDEYSDSVHLPWEVVSWSGAHSSRACLSTRESLVSLNDRGKTFTEIADIIEANWEAL